jgi:hypothetical protein
VRKENQGSVTPGAQQQPWEGGVAIIEFRGLSISEAEEVLADICSFAEEYDIPSPQLNFDFRDWSSVTVSCCFAEPLWTRLMATRMADWLAECNNREVAGRRSALGRVGPVAEGPLQLAAATLRVIGGGNGDRAARGAVGLRDFSTGLSRRPSTGRRRSP